MNFPDKKYKIIYADPPWTYEDKLISHGGGAASHYDTINVEEICNLPIKDLADEDCVLFIWGTWTHNKEVHKVIEAWGFTFKTIGFVWEKRYNNGKIYFGMGRWTRANTEYVLIAVKGKPKRINNSISQLVITPPTTHSKKPNVFRTKIISLMGDLPRIELFARTKVHGWDVWGNDEKLENQPLEAFT